jgi:polyphosphate kinase 2 (PPK2 family)
MIGIFNRSHYENVLISKVHTQYVLAERIPGIEHLKNVNKPFWNQRYSQIRSFEETIAQTGTTILKFFLHLSKDEQKKRFLERIEKKEKHWKFSVADIKERQSWETYRKAYESALEKTSTKENPWYIIPADDKWFGQFLVTEIIIQTLKSMKLTFPVADEEQLQRLEDARKMLLTEAE